MGRLRERSCTSDCKVTKGSIVFLGNDVTQLSVSDSECLEPQVSDRSKMGMGMLFQNPPEIDGLPLKNLISHAFADSKKECGSVCSILRTDVDAMSKTTTMENYMDRDLNVGFSGGERKRCEAFQLLLQRPMLSMLDEPESGVDLQSVRVLGKALSHLQARDVSGVCSATISRRLLSPLPQSSHTRARFWSTCTARWPT